MLVLSAHGASASAYEREDERGEELERQIEELDTSSWDEYAEELKAFTEYDFDSFDELLLKLSDNGTAFSASGLFQTLLEILKDGLKGSFGTIALLTAAALLTSLSGIVSDEGLSRTLGMMLGITALVSVTGLLASLAGTAHGAVSETARLSEKTTPLMSTLMVSLGAETSAGVLAPQFAFLSGTVVMIVEKVLLPLTAAQGVIAAADAVSGDAKLGGVLKLIKKLIKWILGITSTVYVGITAVQGLTAASRDGVAIRTARYALDKLVPIAGGMVGSTADSIMGCALLLRNGIGTAAILVLLSRMIKPAAVLIAGVFIFRAAEALSSPSADERTVRLLSNAADCASNMFACAAVTGSLYALTVFVIMVSGGIAAGLW